MLLELEQNKINQYINKQDKTLTEEVLTINDKIYSVGIVFAEQYISELGNELAKMHTNLDFIILINLSNNAISYRSIKENINLGEDIAKYYGGGGHAQAAGSQISENIKDIIIDMILNK